MLVTRCSEGDLLSYVTGIKSMKVRKTCKTCSYLERNLCEENVRKRNYKPCEYWVYRKASCFNCSYFSGCLKEYGEEVGSHYICENWQRKQKPKDYDPLQAVDAILKSDFDTSVFELVDDSDLPLAPNFLDFCLNDLRLKPFPKQLEMGLKLFNDWCPICSKPNFIDNLFDESIDEILDNLQLLHYGKCPKCKKTRQDFYTAGLQHPRNELVAVLGQRSGKSAVSAMIARYILQKYLKLSNPAKYFNLLPKSELHMTFVAITYNQAYDTIWTPFKSYGEESPWFNQYHELLDYYGQKYGEEFYKDKDSFLVYRHKKIAAVPTGPDKRKLRGRSRIMAIVDELGWFDSNAESNKVKINADEIYKALDRSLRTIRSGSATKLANGHYNAPDAYHLAISSPSMAQDKIMRLLYQSRYDKYKVAFHFATWECNPQIKKEHLKHEFLNDPVGSERDYGANPPLANNPFISNYKTVVDCIDSSRMNLFKLKRIYIEDSYKDKTVAGKVLYASNITHNTVLALDCGFSKNAFGLALLHIERIGDQLLYVTDGVLEIRPEIGVTLNFPAIYNNVIKDIIDKCNVKLIVADRWESIDIIQRAKSDFNAIEGERYSLSLEDFYEIRKHMVEKHVVLPKSEIDMSKILKMDEEYEEFVKNRPVSHLYLQMLTVQESGRKLLKGEGGLDDDIFRAWSLGLIFLISKNYENMFVTGLVTNKTKGGLISVPKLANSHTISKIGVVAGISSFKNKRS